MRDEEAQVAVMLFPNPSYLSQQKTATTRNKILSNLYFQN